MFARLRRAVSRADSWINAITGMGLGTPKNAMTMRASASDFLDDDSLARLYNLDGIAARIVRAVPNQALRDGFSTTTGDATSESALKARLDELDTTTRVRLAWTWARLYGGGAVFVGADDGQNPSEPLNEAAIRSVRFLVTVDRRRLTPQRWCIDPMSPRFGQPETYLLQRVSGGGGNQNVTVHASRIVRFDGAEVTDERRNELNGWGDSILQRIYTELQQARGAYAAVATLVHDSSQGVFAIKDLMGLISEDKDDTLKRRWEAMDLCKGVANSILLDADGERYERVEVGAMTGLVEVLDRFINFLAAVSETPVTVLMGQAPAGLNATGESDIRAWYDGIAAEREAMLRHRLERIVRLVLLAQDGPTKGVEPAGWKVTFPSLYQMTPEQTATLRKSVAETDAIYIDKGVLTPEEVALNRFKAEGWCADTSIDLAARKAVQEADAAEGASQSTAPGGEHADAVAAVIARVAAREIPRDSGVAMLVSSLGMAPAAAETAMGESGRTFFTVPDPAHVAELESTRAENAKLKASNAGHVQYTARIIQRAKEGGVELGAFTSQAPTATSEGDDLKPGDVVEVPDPSTAAASDAPKPGAGGA